MARSAGCQLGFGVLWFDHLDPFQCSANVSDLPVLTFALDPTAVQLLADVHDTPNRLPKSGPGVGWIDHLLPFERSTTGAVSSLLSTTKAPTAVQAVAEEHDTPPSWLLKDPGLGVGLIDHRVPFQRSANIPRSLEPTAVQAVADVHDTPPRPLPSPVSGVRWTDHRTPFQRSTRNAPPDSTNLPPSASTTVRMPPPTAVQTVGDVHDTALSALPRAAAGTCWNHHREPFHCSTSATRWPALLVNDPTAMQTFLDGQDTALSELLLAPAGLGLLWILQRLPFQRMASGWPREMEAL